MNRKSSYLTTFQIIIFALFLILTSWFNRFSADDFYYIGELKTHSFSELYQHLYYKWHGRWTSNFMQVFSFQFASFPYALFIFNLISFSVLFFSIYTGIKNFIYRFQFAVNGAQKCLLSGAFMMVFFFCCVMPSSTWFWHTSTVVYLWSVSAFLFLIGQLLKEKLSITNYLILILCSIYLGGSNEPLAIISLLIFGIVFYRKRDKKLIISSVFILMALLADYLSSGTNFRDEITPGLSVTDIILYTGYGGLKYLLFNSYKTFLPAIFLCVPFFLWGRNTDASLLNTNIRKELIRSIIFILAIVMLNQLIVIIPLGGLAPERATTAASIFISITLARFFFLLGNSNTRLNTQPVLLLNLAGLIIFLGITSYFHYQYANAYDQRIQHIVHSQESIIEVSPLPFSGYIYSAEISTDSTYFLNEHLKNGLGMNRPIVLKKD